MRDEAPLAVVAVTAGSACYVPDDGAPVTLCAGDLLLIARPDPYLFADTPDPPPQVLIHPGGQCETPIGCGAAAPSHPWPGVSASSAQASPAGSYSRRRRAVFRVAAGVGYASPFTFSTAFKRHDGRSPLAYRRPA